VRASGGEGGGGMKGGYSKELCLVFYLLVTVSEFGGQPVACGTGDVSTLTRHHL
jgi:hypothetical protein